VNDAKAKQADSDEILSLKRRIEDKESMLSKLKKKPKDGQ